jgi:hypothetical protein
MQHLHCQHDLRQLASLSRLSLDQLTRNFFFLKSRLYADSMLCAIIAALNRFTRLQLADRHRVIARDFPFNTSADLDGFLASSAPSIFPLLRST